MGALVHWEGGFWAERLREGAPFIGGRHGVEGDVNRKEIARGWGCRGGTEEVWKGIEVKEEGER